MVASGKAERSGAEKEALFLTFFGAKKEAKKHPPPPSRPLYGAGVTDSGGKPPCVRVLVWLTKPVPLRGEPWSFIGWRIEEAVMFIGCARGGP